ncbi:Transposase [Andreprevotia lacus DSM 23236]|jgi:transposase|uniref:Transposase n=1 Tax=Andreprevotia lacus DSM 23236 TaxID=1121001 RepID=A0A1W1XNV1_9NEIS|nr:IS21 family transposase [Andreprevotia lacus]SMC25649.1 Transposase [Andreprevotia lacus DSM 23236]
MKLSIEKLRQVIRLASDPLHSNRAVGRLSGVAANTVRAIRDLLRIGQLHWDDLRELDDEQLRNALFGWRDTPSSRKPLPDWSTVHSELQKRDVTLGLLWEEYRENTPDGVSYAQFTRLYRQWHKRCKLSLRYVYRPGEFLFVDFCGKTMPIRDRDTGEIRMAQIFVGTLGASGYLFATAVATQTVEDWLKAHIQMLEQLGGVPCFIVPDNLKSAVVKHGRTEIMLNPAYQELAEHYGFVILPARPRRPQDKALAEVGVQIVQRWVLARLRHQTFFSLDELNQTLGYWMARLNVAVTRTYPRSRSARFDELDRPTLQPLCEERYPYSRWQYKVRVDERYHVRFGEHCYSVPYTLAHEQVDLRATNERLDIYRQRRRVASHRLQLDAGVTTDPEHLAPRHRHHVNDSPESLRQWAQDVGPATLQFVQHNLDERRDFASGLKAIRALRRDVRREAWQDRLEPACSYAVSRNILTYGRLQSILRHETYRRTPSPNVTTPSHDNLRGAAYFARQNGDQSC